MKPCKFRNSEHNYKMSIVLNDIFIFMNSAMYNEEKRHGKSV